MGSHYLHLNIYYFRKRMEIILTLFGDENFRTLKLTYVIYFNGGHYVKLTNNSQLKVWCMNMSGGE